LGGFAILAASSQETRMNQDNTKHDTDERQEADLPLFSSFPRSDEDVPLAQELVELSDRFAEFNCINAFISEALVSVMSDQDAMKQEIVRGARYCVESLQSRSSELKIALDRVCTRYLAESNTQTAAPTD
jgi:hypothetical protein